MSKCLRIKNKLYLFVIFAILPYCLAGQIKITGKLIDKENIPVLGANIFSKTTPKTGTVSDIDGQFELSLAMTDTMVISCIGYSIIELPVENINSPATITLLDNTVSLDEVVVSFDKSVTKEFSIRELDRISIYMSPISGGDPLKAISTMPYSTNTSESANPELRGSSSDYSRVIVNNVPVYNPVKNTQLNGMGNFSLLNTDMIDNQLVYAGNPPLKYGNSTAGLVEVQTVRELKSSNQLKLALSLANMGFMYSNDIKQKSFFQVYGNHQFSSAYLPLNNKNSEYIKDFATSDFGINFHSKLSDNITANVYSYAISEKFNADNTMYNYYGNLAAESQRNFNIVNLDYIKQNWNFSLNNGTNFSKSAFVFGNYNIEQREKQVYTSLDSKTHIRAVTLQAGISHDYSEDNYSNTLPYYNYAIYPQDTTYSFTNKIHNHNLETYLYGKYPTGSIIIGAGVRKNIPIENQDNYLSFQASLRYNANEANSFILSGGKYNGYTIPNYVIESFHHVKSSQISFDYLYHSNPLNVNFSLYSKKESQPVYFQETGTYLATDLSITGAEISFDYSIEKVLLTGSYVWLNSKMNNGEGWVRASNDMNYLVKSSISYFNNKLINASLNLTLRPGLYYTPIIQTEYNSDANALKPIFGKLNSEQYSAYSSIDLTLNKIIAYKSSSIVAFITVSNLLNTSNREAIIYHRDYSVKDYWLYQKLLFYFGITATI